jgi:hypothetical protein
MMLVIGLTGGIGMGKSAAAPFRGRVPYSMPMLGAPLYDREQSG